MSRSGYSDDISEWSLIRWRGAVASALRGNRGVSFLLEMLAALDSLPQKRLISDYLIRGGEVCALGAVGLKRGLDMTGVDPEEHNDVAKFFGIAHALAREIEFINDDWRTESPEYRWVRMRAWVVEQLDTVGISTASPTPPPRVR